MTQRQNDTGTTTAPCSSCGTDVELLDMFPRQRCLACHARAYDTAVNLGAYVPTADGVARMWGMQR